MNNAFPNHPFSAFHWFSCTALSLYFSLASIAPWHFFVFTAIFFSPSHLSAPLASVFPQLLFLSLLDVSQLS